MMSFIKEALSMGEGAAGLLTASTSAIKGVVELVRKPNPDLVEIKSLAADAIDKLLEAKSAQMAMQDKLLKLEDELRKRDQFQQEAQRYALVKTELGGLVYTLKPDEARGQPAHDLCAACFDREIKSMLQPVDFNTLGCNTCGARVLKPDGRMRAQIGRIETGWDMLDPYGRR